MIHTAGSHRRGTLAVPLLTILATLLGAAPAWAGTAPVKEVISAHIGWEVNLTKVEEIKLKGGTPTSAELEEEELCTVESHAACQSGQPHGFNHEAGGFDHARGIAVAANDNIYIADENNNRVQELTAAGRFVLMFGKEVNADKANVCLAGEKCQAGIAGRTGGALIEPHAIAIDPVNGDVYVSEPGPNDRVDEFTAAGQFVLTLGKEVNANKSNVCLAAETCQAGVRTAGASEPGAFVEPDALAAGGPEDLLYVGDEHRVQELEANGKPKSEISLTGLSAAAGSNVSALALDSSCSLHKPVLTESTTPTCAQFDSRFGELHLVYEHGGEGADAIRQFDATRKEVDAFTVPAEPNEETSVAALAADPSGRVAAALNESGARIQKRGVLYGVAAKELFAISEFVNPLNLMQNVADQFVVFGSDGEMYATNPREIVKYRPVPIGELVAEPPSCAPGPVGLEEEAAFTCTLKGQVDPWGVKETEVWFEWGLSPLLGHSTPHQKIPNTKPNPGEEEPSMPVMATIEGVRPNEPVVYYRLTGEDANVKSPERLTSAMITFTTPVVAPWVGQPESAAAPGFASAVVFGEVNPENASAEFFFEYGSEAALDACTGVRNEACPGVLASPAQAASCAEVEHEQQCSNGKIGTTGELAGLQPSSTYHYRLYAEDVNRAGTERAHSECPARCPLATLTTAPAPVPRASTAAPEALTDTSATLNGAVDPSGATASYTFELGVYNGAQTRYGVLFTGSVAAVRAFVAERYQATGLQPGVTYAYRIAIKSGYGTSEGAPEVFTTPGLPEALSAPAPLPILVTPSIPFPHEAKAKSKAVKCRRGYKRNKRGKCVKAKKRAGKARINRNKRA